MSTKDYHLLSSDKINDNGLSIFNQKNQFNNINLKQICKYKDDVKVEKCENSKSSKNGRKEYDFAISDSSFGKNSSNSWKKNNNICKSLKSLNIYDSQKQWKNNVDNDSSTNSSTLSLHIAAYENCVEDSDDNTDEFDKKQGKKQFTISTTWKNAKSILTTSSMATPMPNPFEFPRQQRNDGLETPEVMQFQASQRLLNTRKTGNARQQKTDRLIDAAEEISNSDERQQITTEQFMEGLNNRHQELGYRPGQVYKAWCKILGNVKARFEENHNRFAKTSDERMANIQRKFEPNFCRPGAAAARTNAEQIDFARLYENLPQEPRIEFRRPGEPANEAANVREIHIDTTQPDGQILETEVLPGNEKIQNVSDLVPPPTAIRDVTNNDATAVAQEQVISQVPVRPTRKRKRGGPRLIPKRPKKKALNLSAEKRSSTQLPTDDRAPRAQNNNTSASQQPVASHRPRSRTTAASQQASSQPAAALFNYLRAPRQRFPTPVYEEREEEEYYPEEEEEEEDYHLRPRRSVRQRGKQVAADERLKKRLPQTNVSSSVTPTQPPQLQRQQPTSERRYDPFEEDTSEVQRDIRAASNRRGNRLLSPRPLRKNALNRRQQAAENQSTITPPNPPQNQRGDDNSPQQRRGPKRQLIQQQQQQVNEERENQQIITIEYPIQDEQDNFQHVVPQQYPPQIEQPSSAATSQLQQPPVAVNPSQVEQVAVQGGRQNFDPTVSQFAAQNYLNQISRLHARELPRPFINFVANEANQQQASAPQPAPSSAPLVTRPQNFQQLVFPRNQQQQQQYHVAMNPRQIGPPATPVHYQQRPVLHRMLQATPQSQQPVQFVAPQNRQHLLQSPFAAVNHQQSQHPSEMNSSQAEESAPPRQQTPAPQQVHMTPQFQLPPIPRHHFIPPRNPQQFQYPSDADAAAEQPPAAINSDQPPAPPINPDQIQPPTPETPLQFANFVQPQNPLQQQPQKQPNSDAAANIQERIQNNIQPLPPHVAVNPSAQFSAGIRDPQRLYGFLEQFNENQRKMLEIVVLSMDTGHHKNNNS